MNWLETFKSAALTVQATTDALGKMLWVFIVGFVALAIATGHPTLLGAVRDRLVLAGVTSLRTPFGDLDPGKIGKSSEVLGINAARASELAASAADPAAKAELLAMAKELTAQQQQKAEELAAIAAQRHVAAAGAAAAPDAVGGSVKRWLYLGRQSGGRWAPASFSLAAPPFPVQAGADVVVRADALLYTHIDCTRADPAAGGGAADAAAPPSFVKAGPQALDATGQTQACDSAGGAKLVWAEVEVPVARLLLPAR